MAIEIAIIAPGAMGSAVARRLADHGARIVTLLEGRSAASRARAEEADMIDVDIDRIAGADIVLSIVPPSDAKALAERLAPSLARSAHKPAYVDCNAVDVRTVQSIAEIVQPTGARFVDGGIIGAPPQSGKSGPTFYFSGDSAHEMRVLSDLGLTVRNIEGPIGAASALKMSYAGINKGLIALAAAMLLAATRGGAAQALRDELAASQPQLLERFEKALPDMFPKAYRWSGEMREIAAFVQEDPAASRVFQAFAEIYERLGVDYREGEAEIDVIRAFLSGTVRPPSAPKVG
jgi:3-hydroxyisobutyrate dehydrogenase-like beta-hydroxyacid dehydrogenase